MKFDILNRWTGAVIFTAEIDCSEDERQSVKLGLAVKVADKSGADLTDADLTPIRDDLWAVLSATPAEAEAVAIALRQGEIDGSLYEGNCACLIGTIAKTRGCSPLSLGALQPNSRRPIERFFLSINQGDTPDKSQPAALALRWTEEWLANMRAAFSMKGPLLMSLERLHDLSVLERETASLEENIKANQSRLDYLRSQQNKYLSGELE